MATIWAKRRPIRDDAERKNEFTCRISPIPRAPAENNRSENTAQNPKMVPRERRVEAGAKIATRPSPVRLMAVVLLPRSDRRRSKSSPLKSGAWRSMCGYRTATPA
jgi:hypothetical protein